MDDLPMYGQPEIERPAAFKKADEDFIALAISRVGSRKEAAVLWAKEADRHMSEGNLILAMRRYNQSWLLDPKGFRAYWGFGRIMLEKNRIDESLKHFETAKKLIDSDFERPALLSDAGVAYMWKARSFSKAEASERTRFFALANRHFSESYALDPNYTNVLRHWAESRYHQGDYAGAWDKIKEGRRKNARPVSPAILQELARNLPEPK